MMMGALKKNVFLKNIVSAVFSKTYACSDVKCRHFKFGAKFGSWRLRLDLHRSTRTNSCGLYPLFTHAQPTFAFLGTCPCSPFSPWACPSSSTCNVSSSISSRQRPVCFPNWRFDGRHFASFFRHGSQVEPY